MSDLHLERIQYDYTITRVSPILVLGGDIGRFCDYDKYHGFLSNQCEQFDLVLLVAGNHEFYGSSREEGLEAVERLTKEPSMRCKLRFLNRSRVDLPNSNMTILGCTLHSHISQGYTKLTNDFSRIKNWSVKAHNEEHGRDLSWLRDSLQSLGQAEFKRNVIIVTHYAPMFERVCHPHNENNAVSQCFSSHALRHVRKSGGMWSVSHWIFGHTHWNAKIKVANSTVLSNQLCNDQKGLSWWQRKTLYRPFNPQATIRVKNTSN